MNDLNVYVAGETDRDRSLEAENTAEARATERASTLPAQEAQSLLDAVNLSAADLLVAATQAEPAEGTQQRLTLPADDGGVVPTAMVLAQPDTVNVIESGGQLFEMPYRGDGAAQMPDFSEILTDDTAPVEFGVVTAAKFVFKAIGTAIKVGKFIKAAVEGPDTPELSVADIVSLNNAILHELRDEVDVIQEQLDEALLKLDQLASQIDEQKVNDILVDAFNIIDMIGDLHDPTEEQLDSIAVAGANLMNEALVHLPVIAANNASGFIGGKVVPALMLAAAVRSATAVYASDEGLVLRPCSPTLMTPKRCSATFSM